MLKRFPGGIETKPIYQKRVPREAAGVAADGGAEVPVRARGGGARAGRRRAPAVGGLARQRGLEPAPGAALRPRPPRRAARRHRPDARRAVGPRPPRGAARRRGAARARAGRLPAHVGLARDAHHGPHPPALGLRDRARGGAGARARGRAPRRGDGDRRRGGRRSARRTPSSSTTTRTPRTTPSRRATRSARCPTRGWRATCAGTRCRTASSATSASTRCRSGCARSATRAPSIDSTAASLDSLLELGRGTPRSLGLGRRERARRRSRPGAGVPGGRASPGPAGRAPRRRSPRSGCRSTRRGGARWRRCGRARSTRCLRDVVQVNAFRGSPYVVPRADARIFTAALVPEDEAGLKSLVGLGAGEGGHRGGV